MYTYLYRQSALQTNQISHIDVKNSQIRSSDKNSAI